MKWFRFYSSVVQDPKVQRLHPANFKHWVNILCIASENKDRGMVPSVEDVSFALRVKPTEAISILLKLEAAGLLDRDEAGNLSPHNWPSRQRVTDDVATRVQRHRKNKDNETGQLSSNVTLLQRSVDTDTDTDTEEEIKEVKAPPPSVLFNLWNQIVKTPLATTMNKTRETKSRLRLRERAPKEWQTIMEKITASSFLSGDNDRGWRADFDWLISNDTNAVKILEGKYDNKQKGGISNDFTKRFLEGNTEDNGSFATV